MVFTIKIRRDSLASSRFDCDSNIKSKHWNLEFSVWFLVTRWSNKKDIYIVPAFLTENHFCPRPYHCWWYLRQDIEIKNKTKKNYSFSWWGRRRCCLLHNTVKGFLSYKSKIYRTIVDKLSIRGCIPANSRHLPF